jgi:hypothetical protein
MPYDRTKTFTVDNAGNPEPIIVQSYCMKVIVKGPTDYLLRVPSMTSQSVPKDPNEESVLTRGLRYEPGDIAGYVETVSGSVSFSQVEL